MADWPSPLSHASKGVLRARRLLGLGRYRAAWMGLSWEARVSLAIVAVATLALGGFFAFTQLLAPSAAGSNADYVTIVSTIQKVVRVREHGHVVVKRVPVEHLVTVKPVSVVVTHTVQAAPGTVTVVRKQAVQYVPVSHTQTVAHTKTVLVHVPGRNHVVNHVVTRTRTLNSTVLATVTTQNVVTQTVQADPVTVTRRVSGPGVTVTAPGQTVNQTVTADSETVTKTRTETRTETRTQTQTATDTVTVTKTVATTVTTTVPFLTITSH